MPVGLEWFTRCLRYKLCEWLLAVAGAQAVPEDADGGGGIHVCLEGMMRMFSLFAWGLEGKNDRASNWGQCNHWMTFRVPLEGDFDKTGRAEWHNVHTWGGCSVTCVHCGRQGQ